MQRPNTPKQAEYILTTHVFVPFAGRRDIKAPKPPLEFLIRYAYEYRQSALRNPSYKFAEIAVLVNQVHDNEVTRRRLIEELTALVNPTPDEIENIYMQYQEDYKGSSSLLLDLFLPLDVLDNRALEAEEDDDADTSGRSQDRYGSID